MAKKMAKKKLDSQKKIGSKKTFDPKKSFDKYSYYENSVQTPEEHVHIFERMFLELRGKQALTLKEDFCGTFLISGEWVRSHPKRKAIGVDLDPEPLAYGKAHGFKKLSAAEKKRVKLLRQDVCTPVRDRVDVIGAGNFSFYIFKEREQLKRYFKAALQSLNQDGILVLEMVGGPGFFKPGKEQHTYTVPGLGRYTYYWDQKSFDPINNHGHYAIHFRTSDGVTHKDCFTYDWRVWTIPELKDLMKEAGFSEVAVFWEGTNSKGEGSGEYLRTEQGDNAYSWIAFVVGMR